jgi:Co/Zn/Cd efflux system component
MTGAVGANGGLRRTLRWVVALNLCYFGLEFSVAAAIDSVSLFADSIDFLEDASLGLLVLVALGWTARRRSQLGMGLAGVLLVPAIATLWTAWAKFSAPVPPAPVPLSLAGLGAFAVNLSCAFILLRHRHGGGSLTRAAFLSARNDVLANIAIVGAGLLTASTASIWPDLAVGLGIAAMNADSAHEVWQMARSEAAANLPRT